MRSKRKASSRPCVPQCKERVMEIDLPEVVAEVTAEFERYEKALVSNDVAILDAIFRKDPRTIRYGGGGTLYGDAQIPAFRAARPSAGLAPTFAKTQIRTHRPAHPPPSALSHRPI